MCENLDFCTTRELAAIPAGTALEARRFGHDMKLLADGAEREESRVGIFNDEARKMRDEQAQEARSDVERQDALNKIARDVVDELHRDVGGQSLLENVSITTHMSAIRMVTPRRTLKIVCEGDNAFHLSDNLSGGVQTLVMAQPPRPIGTTGVPISRREMARRVLVWLREQRAA
ncbi:MAG: hypothetical protein ACREDM_11455 [Methylocella sp.]